MSHDDVDFSGSIPAHYERHLVPLLFRPWAKLIAGRVAELQPRAILETAAGTGVLTAELAQACPQAEIVATDLNPAMLEVAAKSVNAGGQVRVQSADACNLPFDAKSFDVACGQFGIMFYPDRVKGYAECVRVLGPGGTMIMGVWGSLEENPVSAAMQTAMDSAFPDNPPQFLRRVPFSYHDADTIIDEAERGGFTEVEVERISLPHPRVEVSSAAEGQVLGSPLRLEIELHGSEALRRAVDAVRAVMTPLLDNEGRIDASMTALIITASV